MPALFCNSIQIIPNLYKHTFLTRPSSKGNTVLHYFAKWGETTLISTLFHYLVENEKFWCICARNNTGQSSLHLAVLSEQKDAAFLMLNSIQDALIKKTCLSLENDTGHTPVTIPSEDLAVLDLQEELKKAISEKDC